MITLGLLLAHCNHTWSAFGSDARQLLPNRSLLKFVVDSNHMTASKTIDRLGHAGQCLPVGMMTIAKCANDLQQQAFLVQYVADWPLSQYRYNHWTSP